MRIPQPRSLGMLPRGKSCPVRVPGTQAGSSWHRHLLWGCLSGALPSLFPDKGSIHKVVELPDGVQNVMEIQVFPNKDPIQSMILDHARVGPGPRGWSGRDRGVGASTGGWERNHGILWVGRDL